MTDSTQKTTADEEGYLWRNAAPDHSHAYLLPTIESCLQAAEEKRMFDLGCGNGSMCSYFTQKGWSVTGVDPSSSGIEHAQRAYPELDLHTGSAYDDLPARFGTYPWVLSLEVVEHVYSPREYARTLFNLLEPGGRAILSTPYHGYLKNLGIALMNKSDSHYTALWDHGHIKFWSVKTLSQLLVETGFEVSLDWHFVGRIKPLAKSMIVVAKRPPDK